MRIHLASCLALVSLLACDPAPEPAGPDGGASGLSPPPPSLGLQFRQTYSLGAGVEAHRCRYFVMPDRATEVVRFEHEFTEGGHHILLYPTYLTAADVGDGQVFDCATRDLPTTGFTYVRQNRTGDEDYPDGIGRRFRAGEVVMLESHVLNPGDEPLEVDVRLNLWFADAPIETEVGTLFFYDHIIHVPPHGTASARMECGVPADITVSALGPHMHLSGVSYRATLDDETVVEASRWDDAEPRIFAPPRQVTAGQTFRVECDYDNPGDRAIIEGPSRTTDEMCILVGVYWPRQDPTFETCMGPGSGPRFGGASTCGEALACNQAADDDTAEEACLFDTCAGSSDELDLLIACAYQCEVDGCAGAECDACVEERCQDAIGACLAADCQ